MSGGLEPAMANTVSRTLGGAVAAAAQRRGWASITWMASIDSHATPNGFPSSTSPRGSAAARRGRVGDGREVDDPGLLEEAVRSNGGGCSAALNGPGPPLPP